MKALLTIIMCIVGISLSSVSFAQSTLEWDRNSEADMSHYNVYHCATVNCTIEASPLIKSVNIPQAAIGVTPHFTLPTNTEGRAAVTATDLSGNESVVSVSVPFDRRGPARPGNLRTRP